jgi:hypothetical protein
MLDQRARLRRHHSRREPLRFDHVQNSRHSGVICIPVVVCRQVYKETKAVERSNIGILGVSNWYIDPNHFSPDYLPLRDCPVAYFSAQETGGSENTDTTFRAYTEFTPFPDGISGYIGTTTQYPDDKEFLIKALDKSKPTTLCFVSRPAMKLTLYIRRSIYCLCC